MRVIYSDDHRGHDGAKEFVFGEMVPLFEMPRRLDMILARMKETGFGRLLEPDRFGLAPILAVHDRDYVTFLSEAYGLWKQEEAEGVDYALPYVFAMNRSPRGPGKSVHAKLGHYAFDLSVPFVQGTWPAIKTAADIALTGQRLVTGGERAVFALCRPPGHHAGADLAGGYCYINNAAVAAEAFGAAGAARVAILDIDYHHGNGTQAIFYPRDDRLFVSLHGDPDQEYPYFTGYGDETGAGPGEGFNLNLPMPWGTGWDRYGAALEVAFERLRGFGADVLVVSLGVDTHKSDPISHFKLESEDYLRIGERIAALKLPTLFVMEGGYAVEAIGVNTVNLLSAFEGA